MQKRNCGSFGIDVSHHNGEIDWEAIQSAGVQFAILKASEGTRTVDSKFSYNVQEANRVGIPVGFYHFAHMTNDPITEAQHYLLTIGEYRPELWHVLDMENQSLDGVTFSKSQVSNWCRGWLQHVEMLTGKVPMIYTGAAFARTYFESDFARYPLWVAHYGTDTPLSNPVWPEWTVFQYSDTGKVDGNGSTYMDLNELNGQIQDYVNIGKKEVDLLNLSIDQWKMLADSIDGWYREGFISDYTWAEKAYKQELTLGELTWLNSIVFSRGHDIVV
jgi:lysozyme